MFTTLIAAKILTNCRSIIMLLVYLPRLVITLLVYGDVRSHDQSQKYNAAVAAVLRSRIELESVC
jgi:hypothetical protein